LNVAQDSIHFDIWTQSGELVEQAGLNWPDSNEPVRPWIDNGGCFLTTTETASIVRVYLVE